MPVPLGRLVKITESPLLDQSATTVPLPLYGEGIARTNAEPTPLPAEESGQRAEFPGRYVTVEKHLRDYSFRRMSRGR